MPTRRPLRLIGYPPPELRDCLQLPLISSSNCLPVKTTRYEPAGLSFHCLARLLSGLELGSDKEKSEFAQLESSKDESFSASSDSFCFKGKRKLNLGEQDHYALLGLGHLRYLVTEDQIRKSYREAALKFHPDKQASLLLAEETEESKAAKKEEIDQHFKSIQKAYEVLIDPVKRRIYDSTDEFDDAVPGDCAPEDFYRVYGPVFMRNAKWSVAQPVPDFGDENTPLDEVDKFYDFWNSFKSWREFPDANEYDLDEAESREQKRWMERQNAKLSEKARKEESARIRSIVENAFKRDPRILKRRQDEKAQKLRMKQAKIQAKKEKEKEAARFREEERLQKEQEEKRAAEEAAGQKKTKEKEKKLLRKERSRLRSAASDVVSQKVSEVTEDGIERLCGSLDTEALRKLCDGIEGKNVNEKADLLNKALCQIRNAISSKSNSPSKDQQSTVSESTQNNHHSLLNAKEKKERPWTKEEVDLLKKGMQKYPKGTPQRWEVVSNYIGTGRSVEEILKATKTVLLRKPDDSKAFDAFLEKRRVQNVVIESPLSTREELAEEVPAAVSKFLASKNGNVESANGDQAVPNGKPAKGEQDAWSEGQQSALIKALKAFPKDTPQRWDRIAAAVPGKSKGQCFRKFSELKENFRSKKAAE